MKKKDLNALRSKNMPELAKLLLEKKAECEKAVLDLSLGKEKNLKKVKNIRKDISQINTIIKEVKIAELLK